MELYLHFMFLSMLVLRNTPEVGCWNLAQCKPSQPSASEVCGAQLWVMPTNQMHPRSGVPDKKCQQKFVVVKMLTNNVHIIYSKLDFCFLFYNPAPRFGGAFILLVYPRAAPRIPRLRSVARACTGLNSNTPLRGCFLTHLTLII
jgi:hypothetical protein